MVTILSLAFTAENGTEQERCTSPLIWTEQAPHCATPQPYLVPVRPTCSRITHRSGVSGSACTSRTLPLMLSFAMSIPHKNFPAAIHQGPPLPKRGSAGCKQPPPPPCREISSPQGGC